MQTEPVLPHSPRPAALIGWRLLALIYDFGPVLALWLLVSTGFTLAHTFLGQHELSENIPPFSLLQWLLWLVCWGVAGVYATLSWRRGGQTLGMRPWRLLVVASDGGVPGWGALWRRFMVGTVSLLLAGMGFWWAWFDPEHLTWHERASGTRMLRIPKRRT